MPLYDYECERCGKQIDIFARMNDTKLPCPHCKREMKRVPHAQYAISMGGVPTGGYYDDTLGAHIETLAQKRRLMEEQGVSEKGDTPKPNGKAWV